MQWKGWLLKKICTEKTKDPFNAKEIHRILVVRNGRIGDAVCTFPLLNELKKKYPDAEIDVYAGVHSNYIFQKLPELNHVFTKYRKRQFLKTWMEVFRMKQRRYDLILDAMAMKFELQLILCYLNPKWLIGLEIEAKYGIAKQDLSAYSALSIPTQTNRHVVEVLSGLLPLIGIDHYDISLTFPRDKEKEEMAKAFVKLLNANKVIALNVDSSSITRNLYEKQIVEIIKGLQDYTIIILSLPQRRPELEAIIQRNQLSNACLSYKTESIFDVAALLRQCDLLISPDTSLIHIASAIDLATVGIYRNDDRHITKWGPRSSQNTVIKSSILDENSLEGFSTQETIAESLKLLNTVKK
jgi:ADP-heptose:LPS heptosyltransferase